jgi:hypothetical protein
MTGKFVAATGCPYGSRSRMFGGAESIEVSEEPNDDWTFQFDSGLGPIQSPWPNPDILTGLPNNVVRVLWKGQQMLVLTNATFAITRGQVPRPLPATDTYLCMTHCLITGEDEQQNAFSMHILNPVRNAQNFLQYDFSWESEWGLFGGDPGESDPPISQH